MLFWNRYTSEGREERLIAQLYGDEDKINRYIDFIRANHPVLAEVGKIEVAGYGGEIMEAIEFLKILQFEMIYNLVQYFDKKVALAGDTFPSAL